ncbi:MAG: hypothetical protein D6757_04430 [Alphaproteobacteria bacterium]|nr:MAG: hypothetical protein D6757_04430 [Alphaproteobacteria bacterium]
MPAILAALLALAALVTFPIAGGSAHAAEYMVIANAANPDAAKGDAMKEVVKHLFLKEQTNWPGGLPARPLARPAGSPAETAFAAEVLGMNASALDNHWLRLKQTKGETPPRAVGSARILLRLVGKYPGAFSVVSADEVDTLPPETKVVFRFEH